MCCNSTHIKRVRVLLFLLPALFSSLIAGSQNLVKANNQTEINFLVRTKQFNEFVDRFNYKTDFNGEATDSAFRSKISRESIIGSLFDLKDPRFLSKERTISSAYSNLKNDFISEVSSKNLFIYKYSDNIIAEAKSKVLFNGSPYQLSVFLTQEIVDKSRVKWVISGVKSSVFDFLKTDTSLIRFISPSSNETDFMNLKRALQDSCYLQYYASKDYEPDNLTLFFYMINTSALKFEYTEEVVYHIIDIPGWKITVKEFNRNEMNSGWLISDIEKNQVNKTDYIRELRK